MPGKVEWDLMHYYVYVPVMEWLSIKRYSYSMPHIISKRVDNGTVPNMNQVDPMFSLEDRIQSFGEVGKWFESGPCDKQNMARVGMYAPDEEHQHRKSAKCVYCRHIFLDWTRNDNPGERHREESPDCLFMTFGRPEEQLTIRELLELQTFATIQKLKEDTEVLKNRVREGFDTMYKNFVNA